MAVFNEPSKWQTSLVNSGDANNIPQSTPAGSGEASFEDGFPQITQIPIGAGGIAPDRKDFNGLFKVLGDWIFFAQNGGLPTYSADFDYVVGRYVVYNNTLYKCIQANGASSTVVAPDSVDPDHLGSDYWKDIENQDNTSLIPNQTIISELPLTDANLHLKDGALLSGSGAYSDYVDLIAELYNGGTASSSFCTEAEWQTSNTNYGFCNKFVYDSVNNTVRLPKVNSEHGALIKSYSSGADWYRIYQDGWCEQGSITNATSPAGIRTVTLLKEFADANYTVLTTGSRDVSAFDGQGNESYLGGTLSGAPLVNNTWTTSSFQTQRLGRVHWMACGYIDISDLQVSPIYEYIVLGTVTKTSIQIEIDQVMSDLALKADKDLTNINNTGKIAIAHNAMPSDIYNTLTPANNSNYTAPADGYFIAGCGTSATTIANLAMSINGDANKASRLGGTGGPSFSIFLPVKKGDVMLLQYSGPVLDVYLRFFYAVGSESEQ